MNAEELRAAEYSELWKIFIVMTPRRILITSALPYINGIKHLGNLAGSMLPADIYARFQRLRGHDVLYICATDEHGTPAELAAQSVAVSPEDAYRGHDGPTTPCFATTASNSSGKSSSLSATFQVAAIR